MLQSSGTSGLDKSFTLLERPAPIRRDVWFRRRSLKRMRVAFLWKVSHAERLSGIFRGLERVLKKKEKWKQVVMMSPSIRSIFNPFFFEPQHI